MRRTTAGLLVAGLLVATTAGCAAPGPEVTVTEAADLVDARPDRRDGDGDVESALPVGSFEEGFPLDPDKPPQDYDRFLAAAIDDIQAYWRAIYPQVYGEPYPELEGGVYPNYPDRDPDEVPDGCGVDGSWEEVAGNAFYCTLGDYVVYDDAELFPQFAVEFGPAVTGIILAHEWGHAIQGTGRQELLGEVPSTTTELQADCFAGAWVAHVARGEANGFTFTDAEIQGGLSGMIAIGDAPGTTGESTQSAHGSAFDRVSAFQDGINDGPIRCAAYADDQPRPLQFGFSEEELSRANPSDAPFDQQLFDDLEADLDAFWSGLLAANGYTWPAPDLVTYPTGGPYPACDSALEDDLRGNVLFCPSANAVLLDRDLAYSFYDYVPGDFAVGYLVAIGYGDAVQHVIGSTRTGAARAVYSDCLAGAWSRDLLPPGARDLVLSPGDLDEAVRTALLIGDADRGTDRLGRAFDKIDAYRTGVLQGIDGCDRRFG